MPDRAFPMTSQHQVAVSKAECESKLLREEVRIGNAFYCDPLDRQMYAIDPGML